MLILKKKSDMFNSSKFHEKGSFVTYVYVRCGTFECLLETWYFNSGLKNLFPKMVSIAML